MKTEVEYSPPSAEDVLFGGFRSGKVLKLIDGNGKEDPFEDFDAYKEAVCRNRLEAGFPATKEMELIRVHLTLQGGGGQGLRYPSMFSELLNLGIVPVSVSGTSAGAIMAALIACGADPGDLNTFMTDPALGRFTKLIDDPSLFRNGLLGGDVPERWIRTKITELTSQYLESLDAPPGPVRFCDLKIPLHVVATTWAKAKDKDEKWKKKNMADPMSTHERRFVFSQQLTGDTEVAEAVRASISIPVLYDSVMQEHKDELFELVDGGLVDNLPMGLTDMDGRRKADPNVPAIPELGVALITQASSHEDDGKAGAQGSTKIKTKSLKNRVFPLKQVKRFQAQSSVSADDFCDMTDPKIGQFILMLPAWNLYSSDARARDQITRMRYEHEIDGPLDEQTRKITRKFLKKHFGGLVDFSKAKPANPTQKGTTYVETQKSPRFANVKLTRGNSSITANHNGKGDLLLKVRSQKKLVRVPIGLKVIEALYQDWLMFGKPDGDMRVLEAGLLRVLEYKIFGKEGGTFLENLGGFNPEFGRSIPLEDPDLVWEELWK